MGTPSKRKKIRKRQKESAKARVKDSLKRYLADIRQYPILEKEEEFKLARAAHAGDEAARTRLVNCNLRLVVKIAMEYKSSRISQLDLIQEGNVGLMRAIKKFDPDRNNRLSTYAQFWIRAFVLKFLMDNYKLVKVGTTQAQRKLFYNLKKEKEKMRQQGIEVTAEKVAERLDVRKKDVLEMETRLQGREISLDKPVNEDAGSLMDIIPSEGQLPDELFDNALVDKHLRGRLAAYRQQLEGRDAVIWDNRLVAEEPMTLQELGDIFGVSRERARQLQVRILKRLAKFLSADSEYIEAMGLESNPS